MVRQKQSNKTKGWRKIIYDMLTISETIKKKSLYLYLRKTTIQIAQFNS